MTCFMFDVCSDDAHDSVPMLLLVLRSRGVVRDLLYL